MSTELVSLTKSDLDAIEHEVALLTGLPPYLAEGSEVDGWQVRALDWIAGAGRLLTLVIVESVQAFGAVALAILFVLLEADRVYHGVLSLGQHAEQAILIAITLTAMNAVIPIYALRNVQSKDYLERTRWTVRGHLEMFWRRLTARPQTYEVDVYSNPALAIAETTITWATLFLAFYAVLGSMLDQYANEVWFQAIGSIITRSSVTEMLGLAGGLLLSIGGVFGVQSISHELACRLLMDKPQRASDKIAARQAEHDARVDVVRAQVRDRYMAAKVADAERKNAKKIPFGNTAHTMGGHDGGYQMLTGNGHIGNETVTK